MIIFLFVKTRVLHAFSVKSSKIKMFVIIVPTFFEKYLMIAPSQKSASFELAPPHEVPKLNERPGRSFDQIQYT